MKLKVKKHEKSGFLSRFRPKKPAISVARNGGLPIAQQRKIKDFSEPCPFFLISSRQNKKRDGKASLFCFGFSG